MPCSKSKGNDSSPLKSKTKKILICISSDLLNLWQLKSYLNDTCTRSFYPRCLFRGADCDLYYYFPGCRYQYVFYGEPTVPMVSGGIWNDRVITFRTNLYLRSWKCRQNRVWILSGRAGIFSRLLGHHRGINASVLQDEPGLHLYLSRETF